MINDIVGADVSGIEENHTGDRYSLVRITYTPRGGVEKTVEITSDSGYSDITAWLELKGG